MSLNDIKKIKVGDILKFHFYLYVVVEITGTSFDLFVINTNGIVRFTYGLVANKKFELIYHSGEEGKKSKKSIYPW